MSIKIMTAVIIISNSVACSCSFLQFLSLFIFSVLTLAMLLLRCNIPHLTMEYEFGRAHLIDGLID